MALKATVSLDEKLMKDARELTGIQETGHLLNEGLRALVERAAAKRLAAQAGTMPNLRVPARRRPAQ